MSESVAATVFDHRAQPHEYGPLALDGALELRADDLSAYGAPFVIDGTWYFYDDRAVTAVDPASGETLWTVELAPPAGADADSGARVDVVDDVMTATWRTDSGDDREIVQRLDVATGDVVWTIDSPGAQSDGVHGDAVLLVALPDDGGSALMAYDVETGEARWTLDGWFLPTDAGDDVVLVESSEDPFGAEQVYAAVDLADGSVVWTADTFGREVVDATTLAESAFASDVFVVGPSVYVTYGPVLAVLDLASGEEQWAVDHGMAEIEVALPVGDDVLVVGMREESSNLAVATLSDDGAVAMLWPGGGDLTLRGVVDLGGVHHVVLGSDNLSGRGELVVVGSDGTIVETTSDGATDLEVIGSSILRLEADGSVTALEVPTLTERWNAELSAFEDADRIGTATESAFSVSDGDVAAVFGGSSAG